MRLLALVAAIGIVAAACGDDDSTSTGSGDEDTPTDSTGADGTEGDTVAGGEFIDLGTFVGDPPEHIDPALNTTIDAYQVIDAVYDGLTEVDFTDTEAGPQVAPGVAESWEPNEDATVWVFNIRDDVFFSDGEQVLPSSFVRGWERATDPDFAGDYSYLYNFVEGGGAKLDGEADTISGVEADDEAMTLTVTLSSPYSNFDAVAGFQTFYPMPSAVDDLADQNDWEDGIMIGNGPYMMESPATDEEIALVKNDTWAGTADGETYPDRLDRIVFKVTADPDTSFNALLAGEGMNANIPPGRYTEAFEIGNVADVGLLGSYHYDMNFRDERIGGAENLALRQAISAAINREEINEAVYEGTRRLPTGLVMPGIPGYKADQCEYCVYDPELAQEKFDEWTAAGGSLDAPLPIQFNADAGHEPVAQIIVDNLAAVGIDAVAEPMDGETYFSDLADGACVICRAGWFADYPTYDNFHYDLYHQDSLGGNNHGFINDEHDALVDEAKATTDKEAAYALFQEAEDILLNQDTGVIPINWYNGDYAYDDEVVENFAYNNQGIIKWEQVTLKG